MQRCWQHLWQMPLSEAGLLGVALARQTPRDVVLTDGDRCTLDNLRHNLRLNGVCEQDGARVEALEWNSACSLHPDVILGSDIIYDPASITALVALLQTLLLRPGSACSPTGCAYPAGAPTPDAGESTLASAAPIAYICTAVRNEASLQLFLRAAAEAQLTVKDCSALLQCGTH
ncbi:hypothetical protein WJX81_004914 [Elliptochloris bilobata]|uniref:Calmodulin-lysine N-methyltransferase n=1 Tax=Elliptochloris bilobata TaxID=381761 RepID=A0AAW1RN03_9CHLO